MPRLIDLGDVLAVINASMLNLEYADENRAMQKAISMLPTVDAEPVVRCKDCIYQAECVFTEWLGRNGNGFCSCGERREDG